MSDFPGRMGDCETLELLGRAGMGSVYRAVRDRDDDRREVALKVLGEEMAEDAGVLRRFELEFLSRLEHAGMTR